MKKIQLTKGYDALVDDDVYKELRKFRWYADVASNGTNIYAKNSQVGSMHRFIMNLKGYDIGNDVVDHINCNGLDNRYENLRVVNSIRENSRNIRKRQSSEHSQYTGVSFREHAGRWCSKIRAKGENIFLGYFDTPEEAGLAYDRAVLYYFPDEDTVLNFHELRYKHDLSKPYERQYKSMKETNTSGYRGVHERKKKTGSSFTASMNVGGREGKKIHFGTFNTAEDAATIYDLAQIVLHSIWQEEVPEHKLNFPDRVENYSYDLKKEMVDFLYDKGVI